MSAFIGVSNEICVNLFSRSIALSCLVLAGCAGSVKPQASSDLTLTRNVDLPTPSRPDQASATRQYLVGPADKLRVDVYALDDMTREVQVDSAGYISVPIAGSIDVNGRTPQEVAAAIEGKLRAAYVRDPQVSVNLVEVASQMVTVDGEVKEPGLYPVSAHMTLMRVIAAAKGTTEFRDLKNVVILRTLGKQRMAGVYNLSAIRAGRYGDPQIFPNDVVLVGDSAALKLLHDVIQISPAVLAPLIYIIR